MSPLDFSITSKSYELVMVSSILGLHSFPHACREHTHTAQAYEVHWVLRGQKLWSVTPQLISESYLHIQKKFKHIFSLSVTCSYLWTLVPWKLCCHSDLFWNQFNGSPSNSNKSKTKIKISYKKKSENTNHTQHSEKKKTFLLFFFFFTDHVVITIDPSSD